MYDVGSAPLDYGTNMTFALHDPMVYPWRHHLGAKYWWTL